MMLRRRETFHRADMPGALPQRYSHGTTFSIHHKLNVSFWSMLAGKHLCEGEPIARSKEAWIIRFETRNCHLFVKHICEMGDVFPFSWIPKTVMLMDHLWRDHCCFGMCNARCCGVARSSLRMKNIVSELEHAPLTHSHPHTNIGVPTIPTRKSRMRDQTVTLEASAVFSPESGVTTS